MREDFVLYFSGFANSKSRCHIRILADSEKPIVIICSQFKSNSGTSIMNAYEFIREQVYDYLAKKRKDRLKEDIAQELDGFAELIEKTKKFRVAFFAYLLRFTARSFRSKIPLIDQINREVPDVYWIEHWPEGSSLLKGTNYLLVSENEVGEPNWKKINISSLSKLFGYEPEDFKIPEDAIA